MTEYVSADIEEIVVVVAGEVGIDYNLNCLNYMVNAGFGFG